MVRSLILKKLATEERRLGVSLDYLRYIVRHSLRSFLKFVKIMPMAEHRRHLPAEPYAVAKLVATRDEDCGTCVQIEVNLARRAGVPVDVVRAVVEARPNDLSPELAAVYRFVEEAVGATTDSSELRTEIVERWGEEALVELALAVASCRVFPMTKKVLGYATSCSRIRLELG